MNEPQAHEAHEPQGQQPAGRDRHALEQAMAESYGYQDYESFRQGIIQTFGPGMLKKLEQKMRKWEDGSYSGK